MRFLTILGFLGLLAILVLMIIYLLKPNYQQKAVSSTHVWRLSLKYKKKRIPISKIRNILIILCQLFIAILCTFILTRPLANASQIVFDPEIIMIIDASASMQAVQYNGLTRFENAVSQATEEGHLALAQNDGRVTVIIAGRTASHLEIIREETIYSIYRTYDRNLFDRAMTSLVQNEAGHRETQCTYSVADIDGAMAYAEVILELNPIATVIFFTATEFAGDELENNAVINNGVIMRNVAEGEWNAAILDVVPVFFDGFYTLEVEVASFNLDMILSVFITIHNVNNTPGQVNLQIDVTLRDSVPRILYISEFEGLHGEDNPNGRMFSYSAINVRIYEDDSFSYDNSFWVFGGIKPTIRVLYASSLWLGTPSVEIPSHNVFFTSILNTLRRSLNNRWNIEITFSHLGNEDLVLEGFDFYIFEHTMPSVVPIDGIVMLIGPNTVPANLSGIDFASWIYFPDRVGIEDDFVLSLGETDCNLSQIMQDITPENIRVSRYRSVIFYDETFVPLMFIGDPNDNSPAFLVKDSADEKIIIMNFSPMVSNLTMLLDFPILLLNLFDYFFPPTITQYVFDIGTIITLNARGEQLALTGAGVEKYFEEFPSVFTPERRGIYDLMQFPFSNMLHQNFFARIPRIESDFNRTGVFRPPSMPTPPHFDWDLIIYFAAGLVALLFLERLLHIRGDQL